MTALEDIKKALKKVYIAEWYISGVKTNGLSVVHNAADSSMFGITAETFEAEYLVAANPAAITELLSTLESLQRENEELRKKADARETELVAMLNSADESRVAQIRRAEAAEAEVKRLQAEIDRKSSMPGDHRYWEGRYRDEAAENDRLNAILEPFRAVSKDWVDENGWTDVACQKDRIVDWFGPSDFRALASTGGEHHAE